jgi:hypothetical protein
MSADAETGIRPVNGEPELVADGSIVGWDISSRVRINFVSDQIFVTGQGMDAPTERTVTPAQVRRWGLLLLAWAAGMQP